MVFLNDKKYSCEPCIKGHRSSTCKHTDRPLFEIKKKGRPVTQCEHCRELRKTKQVHVKCICEGKSPNEDAPKRKKGDLNKVLASAAFPDGLPEALEASVAERALSEPSSDEDHASRSHTCSCKDDDECNCYTTKRSRRKSAGSADPTMSGLTSTLKAMSSRRSSASALLRPVLPKPPQQSPSDMAPRVHRPALPRPTLFSPYIRAYNGHFISPDVNSRTLEANVALPPLSSNQPSQLQYNPAAFLSPPQLSTPQPLSPTDFPDFSQWSTLPDFGDIGTMSCICGDACSCPGCIQHRGMAAWFNRGCAHPENCTTCLPPVPTSTHPSTPPTTPLGDDPAVNFATLAEWMRNIPNEGSAAPGFNVNEDVGFDVIGTPINSYPVESFMDIDPALPGPSSFQGSSSALSENDMDPSLFSFAMSNSEPNSSYGGSDPTLMFDFGEGSSSLSPGVPSARRRASSTSSLSSFSPSMEGHSAGLDQTHYERSSPHKPKASSTTSLLPLSPLSVTNIFSSRSATDVARASGGGDGIGGDPTSSVGQSEGQRTRQNASVRSRGRGAAARATFYQATTGRMG